MNCHHKIEVHNKNLIRQYTVSLVEGKLRHLALRQNSHLFKEIEFSHKVTTNRHNSADFHYIDNRRIHSE